MIYHPEKNNHITEELKYSLKLFTNISLGIFLFILFFQPFNIQHFNSNNQLLIVAGFAAIAFLSMGLFLIVFPHLFPRIFNKENINIDALNYGFMFVFHTVASVFYIRYVGKVDISFYFVFKMALICLAPLIIIRINAKFQLLLDQVKIITAQRNDLLRNTEKNVVKESPIIEILSEVRNETLKLKLADVILVNSADNYINVVYRDNEKIERKLIRNTLKSIELLFKSYPDIIRCHRTCLINKNYVDKLSMSYKGYRLKMQYFDEEIPVSRQYLMSVKEKLGLL